MPGNHAQLAVSIVFCRYKKHFYCRHENTKKQTYEARIREVKHGIFTPLVFQQQVGWLTKQFLIYIYIYIYI